MAKKVILLVLAFILFTACGSMPTQPKSSTSNLPVIQVTPAGMTQSTQAEVAAPAAEPTQDSSPEATVRAFLAAYETDSALMATYMTPQLQSKIPADGARAILEASGPLQSYLISAGRKMGDSQTAEVDVSLVVDDVQITRGFVLVQQNGTWLIDRIDFKNN